MVSGHFCFGCGDPNLNNEGQTQCLQCMEEEGVLVNVNSVSHQASSGTLPNNSHPVCTSSMNGFLQGPLFLHMTVGLHVTQAVVCCTPMPAFVFGVVG